jgi:hypothetical protein
MAKPLSILITALLVHCVKTKPYETIEEQWGDQAVPKNCFEVLPAYGSIRNGIKTSNWAQVQDIKNMSFSHRITSFKRCFPYNNPEKLTSFALYLSVYDAVQGLQELPYKLDKIGFEYGECKQETVSGEIKWVELQYT